MKRLRTIFCSLLAGVLFAACAEAVDLPNAKLHPEFPEQTITISNEPNVRIHINAPLKDAGTNITLVFFALPNGNSIEHTIGRTVKEGDDWHFNIQHIGAQTRFVRNAVTNETIVVAYLENGLKSWPAWRKEHADAGILALLQKVEKMFDGRVTRTVLTGHSGGGSLTFGLLNSVQKIPDNLQKIGFLDSNYAYDSNLHLEKFTHWLQNKDHSLFVFAYHDSIALLNGKTFVSATGGTWGRSHQMRKDFESQFSFKETTRPDYNEWSALNDRVRFFMKENPEKKVLHTVQVELNGFIHLMLAGTEHENKGYTYLGPRAYSKLIATVPY